MIIPSRCPKCGDILVYDFTFSNKPIKKCQKNANHIFRAVLNSEYNLIIMHYREFTIIESKAKEKFDITWNFVEQRIFIGPYMSISGRTIINTISQNNKTIIIPWFDPDLSDFSKLLNKIKTYLLFA